MLSECWSRRSSTAASSALLLGKWCSSPASVMPTWLGDLAEGSGAVAAPGEHVEGGLEDRRAVDARLGVRAARFAVSATLSGGRRLAHACASCIVAVEPSWRTIRSVSGPDTTIVARLRNENLVIIRNFSQKPSGHSVFVLRSRITGDPQWCRPDEEDRRCSDGEPQQQPSPSPTALALTSCAADTTGSGGEGGAAHPRRHPRPDHVRPRRLRVGQPLALLPGRVRHAPARHARGHDRAVARHRVVVRRDQHGAHPHPARRRHVHRRLRSSPATSSSRTSSASRPAPRPTPATSPASPRSRRPTRPPS